MGKNFKITRKHKMKPLLIVLALVFVVFLQGCTPQIIRAGAERDAVLYGAKIEMERARLETPACRLVAVPGEDIKISGVSEFACYGGSGSGDKEITQRVSPIWNFLAQNSGILGMLGFSALMFPNGLNPAPSVISPEIVNPVIVETPNPLIVRP
jgi:hypothetical protein